MGIVTAGVALSVQPLEGKPGVTVKLDHKPLGHAAFGLAKDVRATGKIRMKLGPGENITGWTAGFVQILRIVTTRARYAGRIFTEGSISARLDGVLPRRVYIDSVDKGFVPFYRAPVGFNGSDATAEMSDHPWTKIPLTLENRKTRVDNFLFEYREEVDFWTILCVRNYTNALSYLAHFRWQSKMLVGFIWRNGIPLASKDQSSFKVLEQFVKGPPTDPELAELIANPIGPTANDETDKVWDRTFREGGTNRVDEATRPLGFPEAAFWG